MVSDDEFERWMNLLLDEVKGVNSRLDALNGRVRDSEQAIAVLKDRQPDNPHARHLSIGSVVVAAATALGEVFHWYSQH